MAASIAGSEAVSLRSLLSEMGFKQDEPTELRVDNKGAVFTAPPTRASMSSARKTAAPSFVPATSTT